MSGTRAALVRYLDAIAEIDGRAKELRAIKESLKDDTHAGRPLPNIRTVRAYLVSAEKLVQSAHALLEEDVRIAENVGDITWIKIKKELGY